MTGDDLGSALLEHHSAFGLALSDVQVDRLIRYYELIIEHNSFLHLVAPCSPEEFAVRHLLESLTLVKHLPENAVVADVGTGAGLPAIPCLLVRDDLSARLIESKEKKARFLAEAVTVLGLNDRTEIANKQFAETAAGDAAYVTCRALDRFSEHLPRLIKWAGKRTLMLFGGNKLAAVLRQNSVSFRSELMPLSEQRYLLIAERSRRI